MTVRDDASAAGAAAAPLARFGAVDPAALARAEAALQAMSGEFAGWLAEEVARLEAARARLDGPDRAAALDEVHWRAHDLKGLGATYGHPLTTRLAASLCRLLADAPRRDAAPRALVEAHVDAVHAAVAPAASAADTERACEDLEARVEAALAHGAG